MFARDGLQLYDTSWYGGHDLVGYGVLYPALASLLGARFTGVVAATVSALLFERLAIAWWGRAGRLPAALFAVATITDLLIGRLNYGLGVTMGLAALLALQRRRPGLACVLAVACSLTSPVAALFLALAGTATWLADRSRRSPLAMTAAALGSVLALAAAFPEGGYEPYSPTTLLAVLLFPVAVGALAGPRERVIRWGAALYSAAAIVTLAIPSPMGNNISRLGAEFALPIFVGVTAQRPRLGIVGTRGIAAAIVALGCWQWLAPVREVVKTFGDPSYRASYYTPLIDYLDAHVHGPFRLEVPFTRSHWESVYLAQHFLLARGWETQLDVEYDDLFYDHGVDPARYRAWLVQDAVAYVALPDAPLDPTSIGEARVIRSGVPYLREVWHSTHWRLFAVRDPTPLVSGPASLLHLGMDAFDLRASAAGTALVRVRWTPYWTVVSGGCASKAAGDWTRVSWPAAGHVEVKVTFSLGRVLGGDRECTPVPAAAGTA